MADIWQPKPSKGLMGSKAFGVGLGIATGNPMMAAGALAGEDSPAGKMLSIYNRFNSLSGGGKTQAPKPYMADTLEMPKIGDSIYNPPDPVLPTAPAEMQAPQFGQSARNGAMGRRLSLFGGRF